VNPYFLAILAYAWWGFVPAYWKLLQSFPAEQLILYRVLFSFLFLLPIAFSWPKVKALWRPKIILGLIGSSIAIGLNWYLYVWAVNHERVVESSLGYFINPLLNVALGWLVLGERLRKAQITACAFAGLGVLWMTVTLGHPPWIALVLAFTFALYGLIRKILAVPTLPGTLMESALLGIPALAALWIWFPQASSDGSPLSWQTWTLLLLAGPITTIPLLAFAESAKKLSLSTMGFFQFLSPSLQFALGVFVYGEPLGVNRGVAFFLIWLGLAFFVRDLWLNKKSLRAQGTATR
jgi:chloramphenicol-sensitive protein RarD